MKQGVQHVLADIMAKDIEIINAIRQRCVSFTFSYVRQCLVLSFLLLPVSLLTMCNGFIFSVPQAVELYLRFVLFPTCFFCFSCHRRHNYRSNIPYILAYKSKNLGQFCPLKSGRSTYMRVTVCQRTCHEFFHKAGDVSSAGD